MSVVLKIENLSKQYRLGSVGVGTLRDDLIRWWSTIRGKENPFLKVGELNERDSSSESKYVWSLRNLNFEINKGDVVGIIGKNGAGKSTLLKIISRITAPTTGQIYLKGKVASLLEVGTGFHPELTGRENIFLNGAILGMKKKEIENKLDEIISFAGIERYVDTPVKRYSSGMYVRLAFAVAAHLDSDILIIDEVLAVGDVEFQKKCLGKVQDLSKESGKTVLFVSHNMDSVARLCNKAIYLKKGEFISYGDTTSVIEDYLSDEKQITNSLEYGVESPGTDSEVVRLKSVEIIDGTEKTKYNYLIDEKIGIKIKFEVKIPTSDLQCGINVFNKLDLHLFSSHDVSNYAKKYDIGSYEVKVWIQPELFTEGSYYIGVAFMGYNPFTIFVNDVGNIGFNIIDKQDGSTSRGQYTGAIPGLLRPRLFWDQIKQN